MEGHHHMEAHHHMEGQDEIMMVREHRRQLTEKIKGQQHSRNQEELMDSLRTLVPDLVTSLELSLKVASTVGGLELRGRDRSGDRQVRGDQRSGEGVHRARAEQRGGFYGGGYKGAEYGGIGSRGFANGGAEGRPHWGPNGEVDHHRGGDNWMGDGGGEGFRRGPVGALGFVKQMVAACLMSSMVTIPTDSSGLHRRLAKNPSGEERDALNELGGEGGGVAAVEAALSALAGGPNPAVDVEEYFVSGKLRRLMVLSVDRARLMKELPPPAPHHRMGVDPSGGSPHLMGVVMGMEPNGGIMGMGPGAPRQDMWCGGEPHLQGGPPMPGPPMYPGGPPMMAPRPRAMGMMGMAGPGVPGLGLGFGGMPPFQRPLGPGPPYANAKLRSAEEDEMKDLDSILSKKSYKELQQSKTGEELLELLHKPTAKETAAAAKFKTVGPSAVKEYCPYLTKEDCRRQRGSYMACEKVHFRRIMAPHTEINLGDCSFLDTCRHMKTCKYVHYELDPVPDVPNMMLGAPGLPPPPRPMSRPHRAHYCSDAELGEPQWINCDIRTFRMDVLGHFGVIMADPPWDIHMELPYGTMGDEEMRNLNVPALQTDGLIFLWVTGRAMELGRECLELWGYRRVEEIIWVKTNQLQRIIRTGRTGHWLNHSKEHCLVGIKGQPEVNRNIDTDVIVAEVRETSRKPDEMYPLLERISPRTRKLELFARMHNTHAGWISLGNQLNGVRLVDEGLRTRFKAAYPDIEIQPSDPTPRSSGDGDSMPNTKSPTVQNSSKVESTDVTPQAPAEERGLPHDVEMGS